MSTRALLFAASAAAATISGQSAEALAPLSLDAAVDPDAYAAPSPHATMAPSQFARAPDDAYEPTAVVADRRARLQCVPFARREAGVEIYGNANTWWAQAKDHYETRQTPREASVVVLRGYANANRGHVAVVREIVSPRLIIVDHANWLNTGEITRNVPVRDVSPNGDWSQVQVWNVPGRHWGGRTYNVQGFILPQAIEPKEATESASLASDPAA
jgi:surface antigen